MHLGLIYLVEIHCLCLNIKKYLLISTELVCLKISLFENNEIANSFFFCFTDLSTSKCYVSVNIDRKHLICVSFWSDLIT